MFLLNLDYLTELSKLGPKSKQGNLHFLTKFWPPQQNARTFQPREWREGELKSKAELLKGGSNSLSCYRFWQKTDPMSDFVARHALLHKTKRVVTSR